MRAVRYIMTHHNLTGVSIFNFSPNLSGHYHVNQRLKINVVHTPDVDGNTVTTVTLVFIAALFECRG
jgi:hypothetical protein